VFLPAEAARTGRLLQSGNLYREMSHIEMSDQLLKIEQEGIFPLIQYKNLALKLEFH
jgi:hypothetical protein